MIEFTESELIDIANKIFGDKPAHPATRKYSVDMTVDRLKLYMPAILQAVLVKQPVNPTPDKVRDAVEAERDRIHTEISTILKPVKLNIAWLVGSDGVPHDYGFTDEDGDWVDHIDLLEDLMNEYYKEDSDDK